MSFYIIDFSACRMNGEETELSMKVGPFDEKSKVHKCYQSLERMCLEYARVRGVSCSYVEIEDISEA